MYLKYFIRLSLDNLISLYYDIMWYIIIKLTLVYWSLYKILKEYSWNTFNKQEGFLLSFLNSVTILRVQRFFNLWIIFFMVASILINTKKHEN